MACWLYVLKHFYSCANERQDDGQQHEPSRCLYNHRQPPTSNHTNDWRGNTSSLLSKARRNDRQTTDRQTKLLFLTISDCIFAMTKCSIINLNIFWWGKWTSLPPLGIVSTALCESFSIVFDRWIVSELLKKCQTCFRMISNVSEVFEWFQMFQKFSNDFKCFRSFQMLLR